MDPDFLNLLIQKLLANETCKPGTRAGVTQDEISTLCNAIKPLFLSEPALLELSAPITVVGDTHAQYHDLLRIFEMTGHPPHTKYLFLGDYVDRGKQGIDTVCLLFSYKLKYPDRVFLLRGNHECSYINRLYGFFAECYETYPFTGVWREFCDTFSCLPIAALIDAKIFCVHGGISPTLESLDDIRNLKRPLEIPEDGLLCDLVWSDPSADVERWEANERGTSYCFGRAPVQEFLDKFGFDIVVRAHQAVMGGYDFPFLPQQTVITLFSAPNYCYEYGNKGAVLEVDDRLFCSFKVLEPRDYDEPIQMPNDRPGTPPRNSAPGGSALQSGVFVGQQQPATAGGADSDSDSSSSDFSDSSSSDEGEAAELVPQEENDNDEQGANAERGNDGRGENNQQENENAEAQGEINRPETEGQGENDQAETEGPGGDSPEEAAPPPEPEGQETAAGDGQEAAVGPEEPQSTDE
jgi:serine/threonine-protein phosphatase PP1 catalytic subunit